MWAEYKDYKIAIGISSSSSVVPKRTYLRYTRNQSCYGSDNDVIKAILNGVVLICDSVASRILQNLIAVAYLLPIEGSVDYPLSASMRADAFITMDSTDVVVTIVVTATAEVFFAYIIILKNRLLKNS